MLCPFNLKIKRPLLLERKATTNLDSLLKSRDITLLTQYSQSYGFSSSPMWMWELDQKEGWALKNLMLSNCGVGVDFLRVPWTARRSNQSILKEIKPEYSFEGLMLKLKLQYFGHLMWRASLERFPWRWERLRAGREKGDRGWDGCMGSPTQWTWVWASSGRWWRTGRLVCCSPWSIKDLNMAEWLNNTAVSLYSLLIILKIQWNH